MFLTLRREFVNLIPNGKKWESFVEILLWHTAIIEYWWIGLGKWVNVFGSWSIKYNICILNLLFRQEIWQAIEKPNIKRIKRDNYCRGPQSDLAPYKALSWWARRKEGKKHNLFVSEEDANQSWSSSDHRTKPTPHPVTPLTLPLTNHRPERSENTNKLFAHWAVFPSHPSRGLSQVRAQ